jgi:hypothetical protein
MVGHSIRRGFYARLLKNTVLCGKLAGNRRDPASERRTSYAMDIKLLGVCGLYCGACYHYRASLPEGKHLLAEDARQGRPLQGFTCQGCRSDSLYVHSGCAECALRDCAQEKEVIHCGLCAEYPCARLTAFQSDGRPHHADVLDNLEVLKSLGPERWLAGQEQRWRCDCGAGFSWYEERCHDCGAKLDAYSS